jgi:hypothetical protein
MKKNLTPSKGDSVVDETYKVLLSRNYQETLFGGLDKFQKIGRGNVASCPNAHNSSLNKHNSKENPSFQIYGDSPGYHWYTCSINVDRTKYLEEFEGQ